jgi:hypothetical protein
MHSRSRAGTTTWRPQQLRYDDLAQDIPGDDEHGATDDAEAVVLERAPQDDRDDPVDRSVVRGRAATDPEEVWRADHEHLNWQ